MMNPRHTWCSSCERRSYDYFSQNKSALWKRKGSGGTHAWIGPTGDPRRVGGSSHQGLRRRIVRCTDTDSSPSSRDSKRPSTSLPLSLKPVSIPPPLSLKPISISKTFRQSQSQTQTQTHPSTCSCLTLIPIHSGGTNIRHRHRRMAMATATTLSSHPPM